MLKGWFASGRTRPSLWPAWAHNSPTHQTAQLFFSVVYSYKGWTAPMTLAACSSLLKTFVWRHHSFLSSDDTLVLPVPSCTMQCNGEHKMHACNKKLWWFVICLKPAVLQLIHSRGNNCFHMLCPLSRDGSRCCQVEFWRGVFIEVWEDAASSRCYRTMETAVN